MYSIYSDATKVIGSQQRLESAPRGIPWLWSCRIGEASV